MADSQTTTPAAASKLDMFQRGIIALWVFFLVLAIYPVEEPATQAKMLVSGICVVLVAFLGFISTLKGTEGTRPLTPGKQILLGLLLAYLVAALFAAERFAALYAFYPWICFSIFAFAAMRLYTEPKNAERLLIVVISAIALSSLYGICQKFGLDPFPWAEGDKLEFTASPSTYGNPNYAGHALVIGLIVAAGLFTKRRSWILLPALLMLIHLYLTGMRSAFVALAAALVVIGLFSGVHRLIKRPLVSIFVVFTILSAIAGAGFARFAPAIPDEGPVPFDSSIILRLNSYFAASEMFLDAPYLGLGPGGYAQQLGDYTTPFQKDWFALNHQRGTHVHCEPLETAVEAGAVGVFFFLAFLLWPIIQGLRMRGRKDENQRLGALLACVFVAAAVDGLFGFNMHVPVSAGLLFLLFGIIEGLGRTTLPTKKAGRLPAFCTLLLAIGCAGASMLTFDVARHSQYARGAVIYAREWMANGDNSAAEKALVEAERSLTYGQRFFPWKRDYPERLGEISLLQGDHAAAITHFERAIECNSTAPELYVSASRAYISRAVSAQQSGETFEQDLESAEAHLNTASVYNSELGSIYEAMGRVYRIRAEAADSKPKADNNFKLAATLVRQAISQGYSDLPMAYQMLAEIEFALGNYPEATWALEKATALNPASAASWNLFEKIANENGDPVPYFNGLQKALREIRSTSSPNTTLEYYYPELAVRMGQVFSTLPGNPKAIPEDLRLAISIAPARLDLWAAAAHCYPVENRLVKLQSLLSEIQDNTPFREILEGVLIPEKQASACLAMVRILRSLPEDTPPSSVNLSLGWIAEQFEQNLSEEIEGPDRGRILGGVGEVYLEAERWEDAYRVLEPAVPLLISAEQKNAELLYSRALAGIGDYEEALVYARRAVENALNPLWPRWNLARRLVETELFDEARSLYEQLLETPGLGEMQRTQIESELTAIEESP